MRQVKKSANINRPANNRVNPRVKNNTMSKKKIIIILIILFVGGGIVYRVLSGKKQTDIYTTVAVARENLVQTVSETGTVKAPDEINLSFLNSGKLAKLDYNVGDTVKANDVLAELDCNTLEISKNEAEANLEVARENLNKLNAGATDADIAVARANMQQAKSSYDAAKNELERTKATVAENTSQAEKTLSDLEEHTSGDVTTYEQAIITARTNLDNARSTYRKSIDNYKASGLVTVGDKLTAANTALDTIDRTINDEDGKDLIGVKNPQDLADTNAHYIRAVQLKAQANADLAGAEADNSDTNADKAIKSALGALNEVFAALKSCYSALENSLTSSDFTTTDLNTMKTNISAQQTAIATALSLTQTAAQNLDNAILAYDTNVSSAEDALSSANAAYDNAVTAARNGLASAKTAGAQQTTAAESKVAAMLEAWKVAQAQLDRTIAPADKYDVSLAQAKIKQAQASLDSISSQIANCYITAPLDGVITKSNYDTGEQVMAGQPVVAILGQSSFEIEVLISETDITKIKINDPVEITLDAYGEDVKFTGRVYFIEPAETVIQDVIYYKVKVSFDPGEREIKSGMTANVIITTASKDNALVMPGRAVIDNGNGNSTVRILTADGQVRESPVTVGLRGDEGMVEAVSGVKEGDKVITYIKINN